MEWLEPELDVGDDDGLLRLPELELLPELESLDELEPDELEPDEVEPELAELWVEPGRVRATAPATTTPATPTVAVVVLIRPRPRSRAATAWATDLRFEVLIAVSFGDASWSLLGTGSQQAMSPWPAPALFRSRPFGVVTHG